MSNIGINRRSDENMYDVKTYTDIELFNILDLDSPSDRELEAKIIFLINKYKSMQNDSGDQLSVFFEDIYQRFFVSDEIDSDNEEEEEMEGFEPGNEETNDGNIVDETRQPPANDTANTPSEIMNIKPLDKNTASDIGYTKSLDYANGKLNPLLQQTVKRVISIDSQYRDDKNALSTDFTFNLSDPLKDVVSLKLYSVQIPYTWYTINNNFGSNFFILKGNVDGINNGNHDYQIDISAGNYSPQELTDTINESIETTKTVYTDASFGNTALTYNRFNSLINMDIDLYKQYNETSYYLHFPGWTTPEPASNLDKDRLGSIPSFLGFTTDTYYLYSIESEYTLPLSTDVANESIRFYIDETNNYCTIYKYIDDIYNDETKLATNIDKEIRIELTLTSGSYTRSQITNNFKEAIKNSVYLSSESDVTRTDVSAGSYSYFKFQAKPDRSTTNNLPNSKLQIQFPTETTSTNRLRNIWTGLNSCFQFKPTTNNVTEMNNLLSEVSPLQQETTRYDVASNPYIYLECKKPGYNVTTNDYKIEVSNSADIAYNLSNYVAAINNGFETVDKSSNFTSDNTLVQVDTQNRINVQLDLTQNITRESFRMDLAGSFLNTVMNFDQSYNLDICGGIFTSTFDYNVLYEIPDGIMATMSALQEGDTIGADLSFNINHPANTNENGTTPYSTGLVGTLENNINNQFTEFRDADGVSVLLGTNIKLTKRVSENTIDATLIVVINKQLTEADYTIQFLEDASFNLSNNSFEIDVSGGIGTEAVNYIKYDEDTKIYSLTNTTNIDEIGFLNTTLGLSGEAGVYDLSNVYTQTFSSRIEKSADNNYTIDNSNIAFIRVSDADPETNTRYGRSRRYGSSNPYGYLISAPSDRTYDDIGELQDALNEQFNVFPDLSGTKIELVEQNGFIDCNFTAVITQNYKQDTWYKNFNIDRIMIDTSFNLLDSTATYKHQETESTYSDLSYSTTNSFGSVALGIKGYKGISQNLFDCNDTNNIFQLIAYEEGVATNTTSNDLFFTLPILNNGVKIEYTRDILINQINNAFIGTIADKSYISIIENEDGVEYTKIRITINKEYTSKDYRIVFYDPYSFVKCFSGVNSVRNATWDTTLGWILGFRLSTIYYMSDYTTGRLGQISADTGISTNLFNYFLITLDDYNQNHLNDGLVTISSRDTEIPLPSYANRTNYICDPVTSELTYNTTSRTDYSKLTQNQIYSLTQIANSKNAANQIGEGEVSAKNYGSGPFAKDVFGIIPLKLSGLKNGESFVEYGGTLQNQERTYFGPVNIHRMTVKLIGDRGNIVDLNGANWSFSLICEQLYKPQPNGN